MSAWFKPKRFGYGATPVTWQGWAVVAAGVLAIAAAARLILVPEARAPWAWIGFFAAAAVLAIIWIVSRRKTEGEWRWRWGGR